MATQYNSIIRLKKIDECLRNRNKKYGLSELIEAIGSELKKQGKQVKVSERTVYDDLKFLKVTTFLCLNFCFHFYKQPQLRKVEIFISTNHNLISTNKPQTTSIYISF